MNRLNHHLRAGALLLTLSLSVIIAVIMTLLMVLLLYHRENASRIIRQHVLQQNLSSATHLLLTQSPTTESDTITLDLYGEARDTAVLIRRAWGIYDIGHAVVFQGQDSLSWQFLMGVPLPTKDRYALYLADEHLPLSISGNTHIRGDVYLPEAGIRRSYIENRSYSRDEDIHDGNIRISQNSLPPPDSIVLSRLIKWFTTSSSTRSEIEVDTLLLASQTASFRRSFAHDPLILHSAHPLTLSAVNLSGHIMVVSDTAITITSDSLLENIVLIAPNIHIDNNFKGQVQAFARDSLVVGSNCTFAFPSVLGLVNVPPESSLDAFQPQIRIDSATELAGVVFSYCPRDDGEILASISLGTKSTVHGQLYADGVLELKGSVHGTTACRRFSLKTPSSLYDNFVLDGVMDLNQLSPHYISSPLLSKGRAGQVVLWLNDTTDAERQSMQGLIGFQVLPLMFRKNWQRPRKMNLRHRISGSTLVEVLVSMVILSVVVGIAISTFATIGSARTDQHVMLYSSLRYYAMETKRTGDYSSISWEDDNGLRIEKKWYPYNGDSLLFVLHLRAFRPGAAYSGELREIIIRKP